MVRFEVLKSISDGAVYFDEYSDSGVYLTTQGATFNTRYGSRITDAWNTFLGYGLPYAYLVIPLTIYNIYKSTVDGFISGGRKDIVIGDLGDALRTAFCTPNWVCEHPLNGYENDACGHRRTNTTCNPCTPSWSCEQPLNGYENDGCGNRRANSVCNACVSSWKCNTPYSGIKSDGCGISSPDAKCLPCCNDVEVYVDDIYLGNTGSSNVITIKDLLPGPHKIKLKKSGFYDVEQTFDVSNNTSLNVKMTRIPL